MCEDKSQASESNIKTRPVKPTRTELVHKMMPFTVGFCVLAILCVAILNIRRDIITIRAEMVKPTQQLEALKLLIEDQRRALQVLSALKDRARIAEAAAESRGRDIRQDLGYLGDNMRNTLDDFMSKTGGQLKNYMIFRSTTADYIARLAQQSQGMREN